MTEGMERRDAAANHRKWLDETNEYLSEREIVAIQSFTFRAKTDEDAKRIAKNPEITSFGITDESTSVMEVRVTSVVEITRRSCINE